MKYFIFKREYVKLLKNFEIGGEVVLSNIPPFADGYYLPPGEYECSFQDIEERFLETQRRIDVWKLFKNFLERLEFLGIIPNVLLIDGSFVTGRKEPGDVDVCMLIPPEKVKLAYDNLDNEEDRECLLYILHPDSQGALRLATRAFHKFF